ncbi:MAG TPA: 30S ribosomal protein S13 [Candidatus Pacearchaeota archaeon]|nr:MAG: 30S ribosomal protein S13 [Candidatus Pacearchaeota archaeon ex4484_31]HDI03176.1 30S ribosomal protein S13 [Candidatus Pacearchaeota archaeon]
MKKTKEEEVVRIAATDIPARLSVYAGLTKIKGISWSVSNAICNILNIEKNKRLKELSEEEIEKIEKFLKKPELPSWLMNRRKDRETGEDKHLITTDLELAKEFDIRRLKKIKCYRGVRHALGLPVRGQRTRSHFRKGKTVGVIRKKVEQKKK